jgi:hypothetical protein
MLSWFRNLFDARRRLVSGRIGHLGLSRSRTFRRCSVILQVYSVLGNQGFRSGGGPHCILSLE